MDKSFYNFITSLHKTTKNPAYYIFINKEFYYKKIKILEIGKMQTVSQKLDFINEHIMLMLRIGRLIILNTMNF